MKKHLLQFLGLFFTGYGFCLFIMGDLTNGLLSMILGELIDMPKVKR